MATKKRSYRLSSLAETDLEDIWNYTLDTWSAEQAEIYHASLISAFEGLAYGIKLGRICDVREGYFKYAINLHIIYFKLSEAGIDVIRILHQRMDVSRHL